MEMNKGANQKELLFCDSLLYVFSENTPRIRDSEMILDQDYVVVGQVMSAAQSLHVMLYLWKTSDVPVKKNYPPLM